MHPLDQLIHVHTRLAELEQKKTAKTKIKKKMHSYYKKMPLRRHIIFHLHVRVLGYLTVQDRTMFINYLTLLLPLPLSLLL